MGSRRAGSATAIALIYPELKGKLNGHAVRVPLLNASLTDCVFSVNRDTTVEEVNQLLETASLEGSLVVRRLPPSPSTRMAPYCLTATTQHTGEGGLTMLLTAGVYGGVVWSGFHTAPAHQLG